ncbi:hypothetical protein D3C87_84830 [compost metagenome]
MKTILLFVAAALCLQAHAQLPYFLQNHNGNNLRYGPPVDIEYDGLNTVYSLHSSIPGPGALIAKYNSTSGAVTNVAYLIRGNAAIKPVRVRTWGPNYYVLFNSATATGVSGYCLVSINAGSNFVNWAHAFSAPAGTAPRIAVDFVLEGGQFAYILSNANNPGTNQSDIAVTKVDISVPIPVMVWDNVYQNTSRSEIASNITLRMGIPELIISAISSDLANPVTDRGPVLLRVASTSGAYLSSMLYKYAPGCNNAEPNGTWVYLANNNFFLSSTSLEAGMNGPLWLSSINPVSLGINFQSNHRTGSAYLNPEIQPVFTATGTEILISGSSPVSSAYGYLHLQFASTGLPFTRGMIYQSTNPPNFGTSIFNVYKNLGTGLNIFSVAENTALSNNYHLLKTDDLGHNDCEDPYIVTPDGCIMSQYGINFARVGIPLVNAPVVCNTSNVSNSFVQLCNVPLRMAPGDNSKASGPAVNGELFAAPNPTKGTFILSAGKSTLSEMEVINADGKKIPAELTETPEGIEISLAGKKAGVYVVQVLVNGEMKHLRIVLE